MCVWVWARDTFLKYFFYCLKISLCILKLFVVFSGRSLFHSRSDLVCMGRYPWRLWSHSWPLLSSWWRSSPLLYLSLSTLFPFWKRLSSSSSFHFLFCWFWIWWEWDIVSAIYCGILVWLAVLVVMTVPIATSKPYLKTRLLFFIFYIYIYFFIYMLF